LPDSFSCLCPFYRRTQREKERERERERRLTDRQNERVVAREDEREELRERKKTERDRETDGGGEMETHNTYTDT
jgi:hypothetical protein